MIMYEGIALTSIDVIPSPKGNNLVIFNGSIEGKADDNTATFLKNITQINDTDFEAEQISVEDAAKFINNASEHGEGKPLFCIHGFQVQPAGHLESVKHAAPMFNQGKYTLVPVMWPSKQGVVTYRDSRETSSGAGGAFSTLKDGIDSFPSSSLLAHSMGNRVLRYAANEGFKFDNIFMVAADVPFDIFHEERINSGSLDCDDGKEICSMLARTTNNELKGKVYVLVNGADHALVPSGYDPNKWEYRLGAVGAHYHKRWGKWYEDKTKSHPDVRDCVENKMCYPLLKWNDKMAHSYQFKDFAVKFYQDNHVE